MPKIPLLDLKAQYTSIQSELDAAVKAVIESQQFILGPNVEECEKAVCDYTNSQFACGVSSGTDALLLALMAEDIGPGDEVITTPYTFFATAGSIVRTGATPVFVDIDPDTYNIDPSKIEAAITSNTKAIIPVHLFGQSADMEPILDIAKKKNLVIIEDAAQAIGSQYQKKNVGTIGDYGCFSFFPSKNLGGFGDGGMVVTQDSERIERLKILRVHGASPKYYHAMIGGNFRLDALQAAVVRTKLKHLDEWSSRRNENAARYSELFKEAGLLEQVQLPVIREDRHIFNQYVIRVSDRDNLRDHLRNNDIGCDIYYPVSLHMQECFKSLSYKVGDFPESEKAANETLAIPIYPELTAEQQAQVVETIASFLRS